MHFSLATITQIQTIHLAQNISNISCPQFIWSADLMIPKAMLPTMLNLNSHQGRIHQSHCSGGASRMAELRQAANSMNRPHSMHGCPNSTPRHTRSMDYQEHYTFVHYLTADTEKGLVEAEDKPCPCFAGLDRFTHTPVTASSSRERFPFPFYWMFLVRRDWRSRTPGDQNLMDSSTDSESQNQILLSLKCC